MNGKSDPCSFRYRCEIHTAKDGCHHIRTDNTSAIATTAIRQSAEQLLIADWDRVRPMAMMMGPVTMGGKKRITLPVPNILINRDNTRYSRPEQATPKQA